jgi:dTDP-4-dehydrorhamnose 3,5-epimerase
VRLTETPLRGAFVVDLDLLRDERGHFARTFDAAEFAAAGLDPTVVQCNTSFNARRGTLRGMHYQAEPDGEAKLVRCTRGSIFLVMVDLRPGSATRHRWLGVELDARGERMAYVPEGFAQGYQTLEDDVEVSYSMSHRFVPDAARGIRWDDPAFGIEWPAADERVISDRDRSWPLVRG